MKKFKEHFNPIKTEKVQKEHFVSIEEEVKSNLASKIGKVTLAAAIGGTILGVTPWLGKEKKQEPIQVPQRLTNPILNQDDTKEDKSKQTVKEPEKIYHHDVIKNMVIADEGIKTKPYLDTSGYLTVGIGHNLTTPNSKGTFIKTFGDEGAALHARVKGGASITHEQARKLFDTDYQEHLDRTIKLIPNLHEHPPEVQAVLVSGTYRGHVGDAPMFRQKFNSGDIEGAAKEVLNREEYKNPARDKKGNIIAPGVLTRLERDHDVLMNYSKSKSTAQK